mmetsp:Transcript_38895/g.120224  ORF Transcript_38895/g.120224 Transcript_38895/m.120224 type:complete len:248 (+) Transcript_38895:327-1070(+)
MATPATHPLPQEPPSPSASGAAAGGPAGVPSVWVAHSEETSSGEAAATPAAMKMVSFAPGCAAYSASVSANGVAWALVSLVVSLCRPLSSAAVSSSAHCRTRSSRSAADALTPGFATTSKSTTRLPTARPVTLTVCVVSLIASTRARSAATACFSWGACAATSGAKWEPWSFVRPATLGSNTTSSAGAVGAGGSRALLDTEPETPTQRRVSSSCGRGDSGTANTSFVPSVFRIRISRLLVIFVVFAS